jgi:DNA-binding HxlR family transcriptional regulator
LSPKSLNQAHFGAYNQNGKNALFSKTVSNEILMPKKAVTCPAETALQILEGRWTLLILRALFMSTQRFGELHRTLAGVSHRTLTQQLRQLEGYGLINRKVYPQVPPKVEYSLTALGLTLKPVIDAMHEWAETHGRAVRMKRG